MEKKDNSPAITKSYARKMETISPFELKNKLIDMADESVKKIAHTMLNAGRGNPNWIATEPREAFFLLGQFGLCECRRAFSLEEGIAGIPQKAGIAARFEAFLKDNEKAPGANLLKEGYNYMLMEHAADPDTLVHEWAESVIGDQYPVPDRILYFTEQIVQDYLAQEMWDIRLVRHRRRHSRHVLSVRFAGREFPVEPGRFYCTDDSGFHSLYRDPAATTLSI